MPEEIEQLGGMREKDIRSLFDKLESRLAYLEKIICSNGRPGLEERVRAELMQEIREIRKYVDDRDSHKQKSGEQALMNVQTLFEFKLTRLADTAEAAEELAEKRHSENQTGQREMAERVDETNKAVQGINIKLALATGALMILQPIILHYWK